jgi:hypothetical protein
MIEQKNPAPSGEAEEGMIFWSSVGFEGVAHPEGSDS